MDKEKKDFLKKQYPTLKPADFEKFCYIVDETQLDPLKRQIYAVPRGGAITIQTSIDGFRLIAERTGKYAPGREPSFETKDNNLIASTAYVKKMTDDGTWHETAATAYFDEYNANSPFWKKMPRLMISKCAEALALRKAFPDDLSGIYTDEEMGQAKDEPLTLEQYEKIVQLIEETPNPEKTTEYYLNTYKINDLTEIPKSEGDKIINFIKERMEKSNVS